MSPILLATLCLACAASATPTRQKALVFTSFRGNGEDGLHLAFSRDGLAWEALNGDRPLLAPTAGGKLMRDPQIARGPDGLYHMVWTTAWEKQGVGYASSRDLIHWSEQRLIPVMDAEPGCRNVWAPELVYDPTVKRWLIYWSSTIPGRFPETEKAGDDGYNHRIYGCETTDFATFTPTRLLFDPGFNCIDATIVRDGRRWLMFLKDETRNPPAKRLHWTSAPRAAGPYSRTVSPAVTGDYWAEGPTAMKLDGRWRVYFDRYMDGRYGMVSSNDLKQWQEAPAETVRFPAGMRHGSILEVPEAVLQGLIGLGGG